MRGLKPVGFQGFEAGVEQPKVRNAETSVERELTGPIEAASRGRQDLANPIGGDGDEGVARGVGHAFAPPAGDVWNDHVLGEVQLGLIQYPPTAGAAVAKLHARDQRGAQRRRPDRVGHRGSRADDQLSVDDLADEVLRQRADVVVASRAPRGLRHGDNIACAPRSSR